MEQFLIESKRLRLREFRLEDESDVHSYASDPEVTRFTNWGPNNHDETRAFLERCVSMQDHWPRESLPLAIEEKTGSKVIGGTGFDQIDRANSHAVFGYVLRRDSWGQGFASEASAVLLAFGFNTLSLHRVTALCDVRHQASFHVMEKLGMRREAHFRKDTLKAGEWRDTYLYALLEQEWFQRHGQKIG